MTDRPHDVELVSLYRDAPSEHVNPVHIRGLHRVYDRGVDDGYARAIAEMSRMPSEDDPHRRLKFSEMRAYPGMNGIAASLLRAEAESSTRLDRDGRDQTFSVDE